MRRDTILSAAMLMAAFLLLGWVRSVDWGLVWVYDIRPWVTWDGSDGREAVGADLVVTGRN